MLQLPVIVIIKFSNSYMYNLYGIHLPFYSFVNNSNMVLLNVFNIKT